MIIEVLSALAGILDRLQCPRRLSRARSLFSRQGHCQGAPIHFSRNRGTSEGTPGGSRNAHLGVAVIAFRGDIASIKLID
jgi:hypothetical protein